MPTCVKCSEEKPQEDFAKRGTGYRPHCKACETARRKPPIDAVPEGFHVSHVGTMVDEDGNTEKQWIGAKPEPIASADHQLAVPTGHIVKGVSSLLDAQGKMVAQWIKTKDGSSDPAVIMLEAMKDVDCWSARSEPILPPLPEVLDADLLALYGMGDPHIGMFACGQETGANHDVKIAELDLFTAVDHLVSVAPAAKEALVVSAGDFFHADNRGNTTTGGTPVDSDGRWPKVLAAGIRVMRRCIDRALEKHEHVTVICEIGNHDWHMSIMLAMCLSQFYDREPRVSVDTSPSKYHWFRFGLNLIGTTHGDTVKMQDLGEVMACDRAQDWGETLYRYWITGHIHHRQELELRGCIVRSLRSLAPSDAWHKGQGYRSGQEMRAMIFHKQYGQISEHTVGINQIRAVHRKYEQRQLSEFITKDSGQRIDLANGMVRDTSEGKEDYTLLLDGPLFKRWAELLTRGAVKYGKRNWCKALGSKEPAAREETKARFKESAMRHFMQWIQGDRSEDHAAAVLFNLNGYEAMLDTDVRMEPQ